MGAYEKCWDLFDEDKIKEGKDCLVDNLPEEPTDEDITHLIEVFENEIEDAPEEVCDLIDEQFLPESTNYNGRSEEYHRFLSEKCEDFRYVYHGTSIKNALQMDGVICPTFGDLCATFYEKEACKELVFAANYKGIPRGVSSAVYHHVSKQKGNRKPITDGVILRLAADSFDRAGIEGWSDKPSQNIETDDYTSEDCVDIEGVITGPEMMELLRGDEFPENVKWIPFEEFVKKYSS